MKSMTIFGMAILLGIQAAAAYSVGKLHGSEDGRKAALKEALRTNPPSEELEMTCLGLWLGEQNKKAWEKSK